jgi:hypothetical protein
MAGIGGVGAALANYTSSLASPFSSAPAGGDSSQVQPGSPLSADQIAQLRRKLQQALEQAFSQGKTPEEINKLLQKKVSDTLSQFGVGDSDRSSTLSQLSQLFNADAPADQLKSQAQDLLQGVVDNLQGVAAVASPASQNGSVGQNVDLLG